MLFGKTKYTGIGDKYNGIWDIISVILDTSSDIWDTGVFGTNTVVFVKIIWYL